MKYTGKISRLADSLNKAHIRDMDEEILELKTRLYKLERLRADRVALTFKGNGVVDETVQQQT